MRHVEERLDVPNEASRDEKKGFETELKEDCYKEGKPTPFQVKEAAMKNKEESGLPSEPVAPMTSSLRREVAVTNLAKFVAKNPNIPVRKTRDLVHRLQHSINLQDLVLVDVRTNEERQVSFLPHSISIEEFEALDHDDLMKRDVEVVTYCTLGLRSGNYAQALIEKNFKNVYNSEGVIMWSHDSGGLPLVCTSKNEGKWECDLENTMKVHCFGSEWERMLNVDGKYEGVIFSSASFLWYGLRALFGL